MTIKKYIQRVRSMTNEELIMEVEKIGRLSFSDIFGDKKEYVEVVEQEALSRMILSNITSK